MVTAKVMKEIFMSVISYKFIYLFIFHVAKTLEGLGLLLVKVSL